MHFLVAGGLLFAVYTWLDHGSPASSGDASRTVHITAGEVEWLKQTWARQWQGPPNDDELKGLVADYLKEELLAREAQELGLDENDTVVRRRLAQKMEFLVLDSARLAEPNDEELRRFYNANRERFQSPARISFTQIFFNRDKQGGDAAARAAKVLEQLSKPDAPADPAEFGDRSLLERELAGEDYTAVANLFGAEFARQVFVLEPGRWCGPVESGYGLHLVRVNEKQSARLHDFAEARDKVIEEWRRQHQEAENKKYLAALLKKYEVVTDESVKPMLGPLAEAAK